MLAWSRARSGSAPDRRPTARLERVLAVGRAFLTASALGAIYLDPTQPARLAGLTYSVLAAYVLYSLVVLFYVHRAQHLGPTHTWYLHGFDILWTSALTFVSEGPVSPFFLFFLFVVLAAAYRWGMAGTLATAVVTVVVYLLQTAVVAALPWSATWFSSTDFELNRTILRVAYLLLTGFLLGYLAEQDKQNRAELASVADVTRRPRVDLGLSGSVSAVASEMLRTFGARSVQFVLRDLETRETFRWSSDTPSDGDASYARIEITDDPEEWLFPDPGRVWHGLRHGRESTLTVRVVDAGTWPLRRGTVDVPAAIARAPSSTLIVANMGLSEEWQGRVYLFDPSLGPSLEQTLHFMETLVEHVTPALTNVFLMGRLRTRVTAAERARVARELHDGAIQALIGIEMKVEALRRQTESVSSRLDAELGEVQDLLRQEVLALRELMQALRPIALDHSEELPDVLGHLVERFRRDTGVPARFVFAGGPLALPATTALEIVRIVQEALVNVRKHSRARNVLVRLTGRDGGCTLVVEDDGVGLGFEGTLSGEELDRRRLGPAIIKERARMAGARLAIESSPGAGARIEVVVGT